jgi:hypothetical protein
VYHPAGYAQPHSCRRRVSIETAFAVAVGQTGPKATSLTAAPVARFAAASKNWPLCEPGSHPARLQGGFLQHLDLLVRGR